MMKIITECSDNNNDKDNDDDDDDNNWVQCGNGDEGA